MTTAPVSNGKPRRKQLSEQLDRFDAVLDGLSEGLSEAIAEAAKTGTLLAVKEAIVEIMTDPVLRAQLHAATASSAAPPAAEKPSLWARFKAGARRLGDAVCGVASAAMKFVRRGVEHVGQVVRDPLQVLRSLGSVKRLLMLGLGVGTVVAIISYIVPRELSALASGVGAAAAVVSTQLRVWVRRTFQAIAAG